MSTDEATARECAAGWTGPRTITRSASSTPTARTLHRFTVTHDAAGLTDMVRRLLARRRRRGRDRTPRRPGRGRAAAGRADRARHPARPGQEPAVSRYGSAGNKDDRFDAYVLADVVRTDRRRLRPLVRDTAATTALRTTVRARRDLVAHRVAAANQLRAHLQIVFPAAAGLFADIDSEISLRVPGALHHPGPGRLALAEAPGRLAVLGRLQRPHRPRGAARPAARRAPRNHRPDADAHAGDHRRAFVAVLRTLTTQIQALAAQHRRTARRPPRRGRSSPRLPRSGTRPRRPAARRDRRRPRPVPHRRLAGLPGRGRTLHPPVRQGQSRHLPLGRRQTTPRRALRLRRPASLPGPRRSRHGRRPWRLVGPSRWGLSPRLAHEPDGWFRPCSGWCCRTSGGWPSG